MTRVGLQFNSLLHAPGKATGLELMACRKGVFLITLPHLWYNSTLQTLPIY
jgi:hypothetical protein